MDDFVVLEHLDDRLVTGRLRFEPGDRDAVAGVERPLEEGERGRCIQIVEVDRQRPVVEIVTSGGQLVGSVFELPIAHVDGHVCHTWVSRRAIINVGPA